MKFNPQLNKEILELRRVHKLKNRKKYTELKRSLAKKYKMSLRNIEILMKKRVPGKRKTRSDSGGIRNKLLSKELKIAKELLQNNIDIKDIKKEIEKRTGHKISSRKMEHIRVKLEPLIASESGTEPTVFGDKLKDMFLKLADYDLIGPNNGIKIFVHGKPFIIPKEDLDDICLILANSYNRTSTTKLKIDREYLLRQRIFHLIEQQVRLASTDIVNTKTLEAITRMYDRMIEQLELTANVIQLEKICKVLKPEITWSEIGSLIKQFSHEEI